MKKIYVLRKAVLETTSLFGQRITQFLRISISAFLLLQSLQSKGQCTNGTVMGTASTGTTFYYDHAHATASAKYFAILDAGDKCALKGSTYTDGNCGSFVETFNNEGGGDGHSWKVEGKITCNCSLNTCTATCPKGAKTVTACSSNFYACCKCSFFGYPIARCKQSPNLSSPLKNSIENEASAISPIIKTYPNPSKNVLNIQYYANISGNLELSVYDVNGKVRLNQIRTIEMGISNLELDVSSLISGIYLLYTNDGTMNARIKFIKQ